MTNLKSRPAARLLAKKNVLATVAFTLAALPFAVSAAGTITISKSPSSQEIYEGGKKSFLLNATSSLPLTYSWFKGAELLSNTTNTLVISNATQANAGTYSCSVTDGVSTYICKDFTVRVFDRARITSLSPSMIVNEGGRASFNVTATGGTPITYQWFKDGVALVGAISPTYDIDPAMLSSAGSYSVQAKNKVNTATSSKSTLAVMEVAPVRNAVLNWGLPTTRADGAQLSAGDIQHYNIYYTNDAAIDPVKIATVANPTLEYVVSELSSGTHIFSATTVDTAGRESARSQPATLNF